MPDTLRAALIFPIGFVVLLIFVFVFTRAASWLLVNGFVALTMRPGKRYTGWRWDVVRRWVLDRDSHACRQCGASYRLLHVHHVRPVSRGGSHHTWNLKTLCPGCHALQPGHEHMERSHVS